MNPLVQDFLLTLLRKAMTIGATYLVTTGWLDAGDEHKYVEGFALLIVSVGWSLWSKYKDRINFLAALQSPAGTPESVVKEKASTFPPSVLALLLAASLGLAGCAGKTAPVVVAQTGLGMAQSIGQLQVATEQLQRGGVIDVRTALGLQERLLALNTRLGALVPVLKTFDRLRLAGVPPTISELDVALSQIVAISQDLSVLLAGVPVNDSVRAVIDLVRASQQTVAMTIVELTRLRVAVEK
jgi:hypothetical protein